MHTDIYPLIRELSGPRPLRRVGDVCSKLRIWNHKAGAFFFSNPGHLYPSTLNFSGIRYVEGDGYWGINLG